MRSLSRKRLTVTNRLSPPRGEAPDARREDLDEVPRRVAEVERPAAAWPIDLALDGDAVSRQAVAPPGEAAGGHAEGEVPRPGGAVRRQAVVLQRGVRQEGEQHGLGSDAKEDVPPGFVGELLQPEDLAIEAAGAVEVIDADAGLHDGLDFVHDEILRREANPPAPPTASP